MFKRTTENFRCEQCGADVVGNGFTNHCPHCLWSKHVDIEPGDRASECGGMMKPIALEGSSPTYVIVQRCGRCGFVRRNKTQSDDSPDALLALAGKSGA